MNSSGKVSGMIFAAGLGTRLAPFTHTNPKALVPVGGVPMLQRVVEKFVAAGITNIVVNVHHFAQRIIDFLQENHNFGANIMFSNESDRLLDTGGGILKASRFFHGFDNILVHNADILTDVNIGDMLSKHKDSGALATLLISRRPSSRYLFFDEENRLRGWKNMKTGQTKPEDLDINAFNPFAFGGVHVISTEMIPLLRKYSDSEVFSIIPFYVDNCRNCIINGYEPDYSYRWFDVGSMTKLREAEQNFIF